jgi:hypothetical protein
MVSNNHGHAAPAPMVAAIVLQTQNPLMIITSPRIQRKTRIVRIIAVDCSRCSKMHSGGAAAAVTQITTGARLSSAVRLRRDGWIV